MVPVKFVPFSHLGAVSNVQFSGLFFLIGACDAVAAVAFFFVRSPHTQLNFVLNICLFF